jgi:hypothetical protein
MKKLDKSIEDTPSAWESSGPDFVEVLDEVTSQ